MYLPTGINLNCGVYRIKNVRNGKFYVGSTKDAQTRKRNHFLNLKKGTHTNRFLQAAYNKETDKSVFEFQMFIYCKEEQLLSLEQGCLDLLKPHYNVCKIAGKGPNLKGVPKTKEHSQKVSDALKGRVLSTNHKKLISLARSGKPSWNKGLAWSSDSKIKMSTAKKGKSAPHKSSLTEQQALEILASEEGTLELAAKYRVSRQVIADLRMGHTWRHLPRKKVWTRSDLQKLGWTDEKRKRQAEIRRNQSVADSNSQAERETSFDWPSKDSLP